MMPRLHSDSLSSSSSSCDTMIHNRSLSEQYSDVGGPATKQTRRRRKATRNTMVVALLLIMAILDLAPTTRGPETLLVMGFSSSSRPGRRRPFLSGWKKGFTSGADRVATGMDGNSRTTGRIPTTRGLFERRWKNGSSSVLAQVASSHSSDASDASVGFLKGLFVRLVTGEEKGSPPLKKPTWISESSKLGKILPTCIFHLRPSVQLLVTLILYLFHTVYLTQNSLVLPIQLIPNDRGNFQSIGLDTLVGMGTLAFYQYLRRQPTNFFDLELQQSSRTSVRTTAADDTTIYSSDVAEALTNATNATIITTTTRNTTTAMNASYFPDLLSTPNYRNMPWKNVWKSRYSRFSSILTLVSLTRAYFFTGRFSLFWEDRLYELARHVSWMTVPMHRSLCVLLGHLSWIALAGLILRVVPRPQPFFQEAKSMWFRSSYEDTPDTSDDIFPEDRITPGQLLGFSSQQSKHPQWVWWALGGYFVSSWLFNVADFVNSYAFPLSVLEQAEENSVVAKLVNPEGADLWASIVGYIAPCLTAPWWEEILYRGFLLPALVLQVGQYPLALFLHGVIFSVHHRSELAFLPLCVLGWTWGIVYTKSRNLWTTIMIHCMWNSRIFLGGWFGL